MMKKILIRFINGFCYSVAITMIVHALIMVFAGTFPMLPEFKAHFGSELQAYMTELMLIGVMSGITSAGTVVLESKKIGIIFQSILYLLIMLSAWIPVACFVWGFHKYVGSMISTIASIVVTYGICFGIKYKSCKKDINKINARLMERG